MSHHEDLGVDSQEDADRKYLAVKRANAQRASAGAPATRTDTGPTSLAGFLLSQCSAEKPPHGPRAGHATVEISVDQAREIARLLVEVGALRTSIDVQVDAHLQQIEAMRATRDGIQRELMAVTTERDTLRASLDAAERERDAYKAEAKLAVHKVITCGVAAHHPDPTLTTRGAYAGKWDSAQAQDVRKLRLERDGLREALRKINVAFENTQYADRDSEEHFEAIQDMARDASTVSTGEKKGE